ncbi:cation:proton antiporter [candidate division MSBL1 archaeon SCGC-AAA261C02]|uniref:Cation:proton antiporter n=1 Tax=candidate division MSBL1 archaeon SCGC-AAA261C02 TaxID=1698272 RepID=A0A133V025_9EURY|nr:cation:proton antiporter [candidate division MSBL1 archaeon SCGC-AAA261C02]
MILGIVIILVGATLLCLGRVVIGPTAPDRVVSIDSLTSLLVAALVLLGVWYEQSIFLDVALVYAFLAFIGTLAVSKYLEGRGLEE